MNNIGILSTFINSMLGISSSATESVDLSESTKDTKNTDKTSSEDSFGKKVLKALDEERKISGQAGAPTTKPGLVAFADEEEKPVTENVPEKPNIDLLKIINNVIDTAKSQFEKLGIDPEAIQTNTKSMLEELSKSDSVKKFIEETDTEKIKAAREKNEHYVGATQIDGVSKELIKSLAAMGKIDVGNIDDLDLGKTLEEQKDKLTESQLKNLTEMADNLKDNNKIGNYIQNIQNKHAQQVEKEFDERLKKLEQAKQGIDPDLIQKLNNENKKFAQKLMNDYARLKFWEEQQKWKNAQLAATLAAIHDSAKLAKSVQ